MYSSSGKRTTSGSLCWTHETWKDFLMEIHGFRKKKLDNELSTGGSSRANALRSKDFPVFGKIHGTNVGVIPRWVFLDPGAICVGCFGFIWWKNGYKNGFLCWSKQKWSTFYISMKYISCWVFSTRPRSGRCLSVTHENRLQSSLWPEQVTLAQDVTPKHLPAPSSATRKLDMSRAVQMEDSERIFWVFRSRFFLVFWYRGLSGPSQIVNLQWTGKNFYRKATKKKKNIYIYVYKYNILVTLLPGF